MAKTKLSTGKKAGIIAGCVAGAEALVGVGALMAAPFTGGATVPAAVAMFSASAKNIAIVGGAAIGGAAVGTVITKKIDSKKEANAYGKGYGDASAALDAHFMQLLPEDMRSW